jgi:hypothetical protein
VKELRFRMPMVTEIRRTCLMLSFQRHDAKVLGPSQKLKKKDTL